jgi:hypothetical protein
MTRHSALKAALALVPFAVGSCRTAQPSGMAVDEAAGPSVPSSWTALGRTEGSTPSLSGSRGDGIAAPPSPDGSRSAREDLAVAPDHQSPPWRVGPVLLNGTGRGLLVALFHEGVSFDVTGAPGSQAGRAFLSGEVDGDTNGLSVGMTWGRVSVEALLGVATFAENGGGQVETEPGIVGGVRAGCNVLQVGRLAFGLDGAFTGGQAEINSLAGSGSELRWIQGDLRAAAAYAPSSDALLSFAPFGGVGLRLVDGLQDLRAPSPGDEEFEATLVYGIVGASANWRPEIGFQAGVEANVLVGDMQGITVSLVFSY